MNPLLNGIQINDIVYGSPTKEQVDLIKQKGKSLKAVLSSEKSKYFFNKQYPDNVSLEVREELKELQKRTENINKQDLEFAKISEKDHYQSWVDFLYSNGISINKNFFNNITANTDGLIYATKYHYNRPRPFQLGVYHRLPVNQTILTSANSPAFPSGHAFEAKLFALILSEKYPHAKIKINDFAVRHAESRLNAGIHYRSDMEFGYELAEWVFSTKSF